MTIETDFEAPRKTTAKKEAEVGEGASYNQKQVIAFLSSPDAYDGQDVERINTHISCVFLVEGFVYKLKKDTALTFLDFSTLEARRVACEREVEINRKTAPEIYLCTVPVTRRESGFEIDGKGVVVDWLVKMNRFDQSSLFSQLIKVGGLKESLVSDLAEQVGRHHLSAERKPEFGGYASVRETLDGVTMALRGGPDGVFRSDEVEAWVTEIGDSLQEQKRRLDVRRRSGFVRHCHGDMHLGNICLINGRPTPFDAIEFRQDYASIDVLYDLAFPVMDLIHSQAKGLANLLINRYLEVTCDYSGLHLMPLFLSLRAGVRAMVYGIEASDGEQSQEQRDQSASLARSYLEVARSCLIRAEPRLIAIGGYSGTGKSTLARLVSEHGFQTPGTVILRSDAVRKRIFRQPALVPLPKKAYGDDVDQRVMREMCRDAHRALTAGWSVIVDATFIDPNKRKVAETIAKKKSVPFKGIWLDASPDILIERVIGRRGDVSDADELVVKGQLEQDLGHLTWQRVSAEGPMDATLGMALKEINQ
jgi:uncharacterized protein